MLFYSTMKYMRKSIVVFLLLLVLCSCSSKKIEEKTLNILCPTGAPSLAFLNKMGDVSFETNSNTSNILAYFSESSNKDIIVFDTVNGIRAILKGAPYKLACTLTFGNFYLVSTGNDDNGALDSLDTVILFGEKGIPDFVFRYLYGSDLSIEYVGSVSDAAKCLAAGKNMVTGSLVDYVFIAEPILTTVLNNKDAATYGKASIYANIQEEYFKRNGTSLIQASLFVKDNVDIDDFLSSLENEIHVLLSDESYVLGLIDGKSNDEISAIYGIGIKMIPSVLKSNKIGLGYQRSIDIKEDIDSFIELFGLEKTDESIYYQ